MRMRYVGGLSAVILHGLLFIGGCDRTGSEGRNSRPDPDSIAEAPQPEIQASTFVAAGDLAMSRGKANAAADQYEKAIHVNSDDPAVNKKLALAYVRAGRASDGVKTFEQYLRVSDGSADAYGCLGYAYELAGEKIRAEQTYQDGIAKHPDGSLIRVNYGLMLVRQNKIEQAVEQLQTVLAPHEVNYDIASVYEQMGRPDLAQFYYRRSLQCEPTFSPAKKKLLTASTAE